MKESDVTIEYNKDGCWIKIRGKLGLEGNDWEYPVTENELVQLYEILKAKYEEKV
jgi:hypothetical protein